MAASSKTISAKTPPISANTQSSRHLRRRFTSFDELLAEVRVLGGRPTEQLGNWSLGQICQHLGIGMRETVEAKKLFDAPLWLRLLGPWIRPRILKRGLPRGFQIPRGGERLIPPPISFAEGYATLEAGIGVLKSSDRRIAHPVFGRMNLAEWDQFHLRHAELHLSFIVPTDADVRAAAASS